MSRVLDSDITVCGRRFSQNDIFAIGAFIASHPAACRREIATWACELFGWLGPNGRRKGMSCRLALLRIQALGRIQLPPTLKQSSNRKAYAQNSSIVEP